MKKYLLTVSSAYFMPSVEFNAKNDEEAKELIDIDLLLSNIFPSNQFIDSTMNKLNFVAEKEGYNSFAEMFKHCKVLHRLEVDGNYYVVFAGLLDGK